jgi:hypothetical protein
LVYLLATQLSGSFAGVAAAASYALLSADAGVLGFHAHATHYVVFFAMLGALLLLAAERRKSVVLLALSGVSMGMALLMKQHGLFFIVFGLLCISYSGYKVSHALKRVWLVRATIFGTASLLPYALVCLLMWLYGVFPRFWFWTFVYARAYTSEMSLHDAKHLLASSLHFLLSGMFWMWVLSGGCLLGLLVIRRTRKNYAFLFLLVFCSAASVCPGFYFRIHYFVLLLPAMALVLGIGLGAVHEQLRHSRSWLLRFSPTIVLLLAMGISFYQARVYFLELNPIEEVRFNYGSTNPFPEAIAIARYLQEHTKAGDRISIMGSEPEILFYAHRLSATGHIYTYGLMEPQPYAHAMQHEFIRETEQSAPEYVVFVPFNTSWSRTPRSIPDLWEWIPQFLIAHYDRVGIINIEATRTSYFWDESAQHAVPAPLHMFVLRRRPIKNDTVVLLPRSVPTSPKIFREVKVSGISRWPSLR